MIVAVLPVDPSKMPMPAVREIRVHGYDFATLVQHLPSFSFRD